MAPPAAAAAITAVACWVSCETPSPRRVRSSSSAISRAERKRSDGSLASARITTCSSAGEISRFLLLGGGGGSFTCFIAISTAEPPVNGTRPVSIS